MRKFVFSIISIVNMILVGIAFGLGANSAAYITGNEDKVIGNFYQLVFKSPNGGNPSWINILCFALIVLAAALAVVALIPFKGRKFVNILGGGSFIAAGVLTLWVPTNYMELSEAETKLSFASKGSLIAMSVLLLVAGALALIGAIVEFLPSKKEN